MCVSVCLRAQSVWQIAREIGQSSSFGGGGRVLLTRMTRGHHTNFSAERFGHFILTSSLIPCEPVVCDQLWYLVVLPWTVEDALERFPQKKVPVVNLP